MTRLDESRDEFSVAIGPGSAGIFHAQPRGHRDRTIVARHRVSSVGQVISDRQHEAGLLH